MKSDEMNDAEKGLYNQLMGESRPELNKHRNLVIFVSALAFVVVALLMFIWQTHAVALATVFQRGGLLYSLYGAGLLSIGAISKPATLGLMSMARYNYNTRLFRALMKARFSAHVGFLFVVTGFGCQSAGLFLDP